MTDNTEKYPIALSIAGLDPSGGAGILADVKTFGALGVYGCAVVTAITAQSTVTVDKVVPVSTEILTAQLYTLLDDIRPDAVKIGMLPTSDAVEAVAEAISRYGLQNVVVDPVLISSSGTPLTDDLESAIRTRKERLFPLATLVTPNAPEAEAFALSVAGDTFPVLLKGGHSADPSVCTDTLVLPDGSSQSFTSPRISSPNTHGTGCVLSSAIAAGLALGYPLEECVARAKSFLTRAIQRGKNYRMGHGAGPLYLLDSSFVIER